MSNSGYRRRSFGPRGARTNGPANGFNGPRFPNPNFNHPRPPHRLPGPEKWIERPNYAPWQQNKNFHPHPQYRGNLQYRPNNRGRAAGGRGIVRFSGPGRPSAPQFCMGFIRNPIHRTVLSQEEQVEEKPALIPQTPLLGSEEERQQKISETADKLKQKLSSITEEELTNFWEDDLSVLPNNSSEEENTRNKGIPELRHEPPELDLTFTDFRDIGRVDCNNSKFENIDSKSNDEISISFEQKHTDNIISTNDEIIIIDENKEESLIISDSTHDKEDYNRSNILLEDDECHKQIHDELSDFECNIESLQLQDDNIGDDLISSNLNDADEKSSTLNLDRNVTNLIPIESVNELTINKTLDVNDIDIASITNDQDGIEVDFSQNQNSVLIDIQDVNRDITEDTNVDVQRNDYTETKLFEDNRIQDNSQTNVCQETPNQNLLNVSDSSQNRPFDPTPSNEETHSSIVCNSTSPAYLNYNEVHKINDDKKLNNPPIFQPRVFNVPPRFTPRVGGPRCRWTFQQNGKNVFFRGPQRLPFHGNRISPPRHVAPFTATDLVPIGFDPRAPPPFSHSVPVPSHDSQHNALVPFSSNDLPPAFDPSEPPPNIRSKPGTESSNIQENTQSMPSLDSRGQTVNTPKSNLKVIPPPPAFDPRGPPPRITNVSVVPNEKLPEFNPQQPPPRIHKREETLQPPPIFDPRLSSQERSNLIAPLDTSRSKMMPMNLIETSPVSDFNIGSVTPNFPQLPPINIPSHQPFISNVQMNFQPVLSQTNNGQGMMREFPLPPPPMSITEVLPPPPKEPSVEGNSNPSQSINMDDGLEDMQEAMEFAKQIMNMTEEVKNENVSSVFSELSLTTSEIPVPNETASHSLPVEEGHTGSVKKQRKKESKNKKSRQNVVCGPELIPEKQEETIDEEHGVQNQNKNIEDALLSNDQIRPKVVFNLNSKTKKIHKPEEWHRTSSINITENKETFQQITVQNSNKQRTHSRKHSSERRRSSITNQTKNQQKESNVKKNDAASSVPVTNTSIHEKSNDTFYRHKNYIRDLEKLHPHSSNIEVSNNINSHKNQKSKKESRKERAPTAESSWKNRVISRFLKMSKNDICNMVNNSSLRKFDIAMKHLVKERRSSLSLEMRNTEDEKMKEYDREEFMNQLNAMLDPSAVVGITDLPTEFIHHLSEVLQLDPMPFDAELSKNQNADIDEVKIINQDEILRVHVPEYSNDENLRVEAFPEYIEPQNISEEHVEEQFLYNKEEPTHYSLNMELNLNISRENTNSSHRSLSNKLNLEVENMHKKQQQPLFNEADLDDILSEVTERTKNLPNASSTLEPDKFTEARTGSSSMQTVTEAFECNTFSQIPNKTAADLDDIFSAGIARVKLLGKSNANSDRRARKSSSEDRSTFRSERYERWNRKERDDPDAFRNLTKEEWEAKYGLTNAIAAPTIVRRSASNSTESLSKDSRNNYDQRYCSSDSPMRHLSISPLTYEPSVHNLDRCIAHPNEIELQRIERSESSSDSSSTSSSDSDEETVAPNVTKLLKVIKEKEKIAKKKSLNETIRDEVTAEIEKKWKEKSKHKERKFRKREKRKKDKKEKRRKDKKKKRKRNSYSDSSKCGEQLEGFRLLTEDEIKKEVIVKEEPVSSFEDNVSFNSGVSNTYLIPTSVDKTFDLQIESQSSQIEKEQVPAITCDTVSSQIKNKPTIISVMAQPKTKAQLKQMPESSNIEQKQLMEIAAKVIKTSTGNTDNETMKNILETNKDNETAKNNDERIDTVSLTSIFSQHTNVSLNLKEPSFSVQPQIETTNHNNTAHTTSLTCSTLNPVVEISTSNQCTDQKTSITSTSSTENKSSGYKKIDIKAYKERALQRRLKEQAILKENSGNSAPLIQESHHALPINKSNIESLNTMNEIKTAETDANKVQLMDPRLSKTRSTSVPSLEDSDKEVTEKTNLEECRSIVVTQNDKEFLTPIESASSGEKNVTRAVDSDLQHTHKDPMKYKERKNNNKSLTQEAIPTRKLKESSVKEKSKIVSEENKSKKSSPAVDSSKFKYIRSEGSKELKLKKEKTRKSSDKKKKDLKPNDPQSLITEEKEKHVEKHSHKKVVEDNQEALSASKDTTSRTEIEKTNSHDSYEDLSKLETTTSATCSNLETSIDRKTIQEQTNINSVEEQNDQESTDSNKESTNIDKKMTLQVNEIIPWNQQLVDQNTVETEDDNLMNPRNEEDGIKVLEESTSIENLNKQKDTCKDISSIGSISLDYTELISIVESYPLSERIDIDIEKNGCLINVNDLKNIETHGNSTLATEMNSKVIADKDNANVETNNVEQLDKSASTLDEKQKNSSNCGKIVKNDTRSPDSPSSPFKGFLVDSIDEVICQDSQLYNTKVNNVRDSVEGGEDNGKGSPKKMKEENETTSMCNSVEEQQNVTNVTNDAKADTSSPKTEKRNLKEQNGETYELLSEQQNALSVDDMDQHTFDDDNEPFIVLDEYIDDTDGKSIEKLSTLEIDLEDCIARDANIFMNKSLQGEENPMCDMKSPNFNSIDFKELSEVFDKNNVDKEQNQNNVTPVNKKEESALSEENIILSTELFLSKERTINVTDIVSSTSESMIESSSKADKLIDSTVSEIPKKVSQNVISTTSRDISQRSATPELSIAETRRIEEENHYYTNISENNLEHSPESFSIENKSLSKLNVPIKIATKISSENFPVTVSISETSSEFLELKKQQELDYGMLNEHVTLSSKIKTSSDKDASVDCIIEHETSKNSNKTSSNKSSQGGGNEMLHKIKSKSKMKHKKQKRDISEKVIKEVMKSDTVKIKYPSTKEAIMARMIEIDVEIHKLMTEKMTLYQMLTSDNLPSDNNLQQNNVTQEVKEIEAPVIRPRTPSALMSQLIQNIETSPVKNQCAKTSTENLSTKDNSITIQPNKPRTLSKHEHRAEKKENCTSTCGSDDEENAHHAGGIKTVSRKRKKLRLERTAKIFKHKLDSSVSTEDAQNIVAEKIRDNDTTKLGSKKINARQVTIEQDSSQVSLDETKSQEAINKISIHQIDKKDSSNNNKVEVLKYQEVGKIIKPTESQISLEEIVQTKITEHDKESCLVKDNEEKIENLSEKGIDANPSEKPPESRTSERSSIYSDDSTWDSLLQNSSIDEQKKPSTGLALLEETYRKEMAKTRKIKAAVRKRKKKKLQNLLETVNVLTPDEEELPLSALYIKKLHQKKKLLNSLEQQTKQQTDDDPQLWKNVVEVINAVAENRTGDLYVDPLKERSIGNTEDIISDILELEENAESKEYKEEHMVSSSTLRNTKEVCFESSTNVNISCENKDDSSNIPKKDDLQLLSSKSQKFLSSEHFQQNLEISIPLQVSQDLFRTPVCNTSANIENNVIKSPIQQTVESTNVEINQPTVIQDSDSCLPETSSSNTQNDRNVQNISENMDTEKAEEKTNIENEESNLQEEVAKKELLEKNIVIQKSANSESVLTSDDIEKSQDSSIESNNDKNTAVTSEITSKENPLSNVENINEGKLQDCLASCEGDDVSNATEELNCTSQNEHFISLKEHRGSHKRKDIEQFNKASSEENNNQNCASVSSITESTETFKSDETFGKKSSKRKRGSSKTPLRRSSRYTEEPAKRIKLEVDVSPTNTEPEIQENNFKMQIPNISSTSVSPCEEVETIWMNPKKNRIQKSMMNKKRCTPVTPEIEILYSNNESLKEIKRCKQHSMSEMMNCVVRVVDCKHTILNPNANSNILQKYGIFRVNTCMYSNSTQLDSFVNSIQSTSTKDLSAVYTKQTTSLTEFSQSQTSKLIKKFDDTTRPVSDQINATKVKKILKPAKVDSPVNDKEECVDPDIEVMPVLTKEPVTMDITQNCEKPDIEIVEEKTIVTKNQQHSNSGSTLTVIDTKDDKEIPRTQYTVHKGPILDIKVFENSFLAASEDGRIYRYNQASNGILNIYKGHKSAVTCLYVHNVNNTDISKEWMFSGSLDGTLRCYNIITGVQVRDTADIGSPIQCMDEEWGIIFIGTKSGHVSRYHMKSGVIKGNSIQFSDKSVLALKATNEGPRRVLIVASRSQPITIRDAQNGLFLRTICGQKSHTVYSLMRDNNLIYCGTSSTSIPVFDFTNGEQTMQYDAGVGIVCMRLYKQLLFAGCYDGNIYVFDTKDYRLVCSIPGPGNMLLSMEVIDNKIIAGSKDKRLQSWQMPWQVRSLL